MIKKKKLQKKKPGKQKKLHKKRQIKHHKKRQNWILFIIIAAIIVILLFIFTAFNTEKKSIGRSTTPTSMPAITIDDYSDTQLIIKTNNGSLPPPHHRETTLSLYESPEGSITADLEIRDYDNIIDAKSLSITQARFENLIDQAIKFQNLNNISTDCAGSSSISIEILKENKKLLEINSDNCAGNPAYKKLRTFSDNIEK